MRLSACRTPMGMIVIVLASTLSIANAGGMTRKRTVVVTPTVYGNPANANADSNMLGTFYSTPILLITGDFPAGRGYSPLGQYGTSTLSTYGPISAYRSVSAPIRVYSRGYNGEVLATDATTTSNPYLPEPQPVIYPTANSNYYKPRRLTSPPWWQSGINWVDQN